MFPLCIKVFIDVVNESPPAIVMWVQRRHKQHKHFMTQKTAAVEDQWNYISNTFIQQNDAGDCNRPHCQHAESGIEIEMFVGTWRPFIPSCNYHT